MGSINKRPLKAYVRYDASGRVVAGSLVLRRKMPKNGNWKELPQNITYECCSPTTTTTSSSTTTAAPLPACNYSEAGDAADACSETIDTAAFIEQSDVAVVSVGDVLYNDAGGNNPVDGDTLYHKVSIANGTTWSAQLALDGSVLAVDACP
tara:strand:+ start:199 stop:651 length:453 start_codon:yes stop_codon:yes gene_type:complete